MPIVSFETFIGLSSPFRKRRQIYFTANTAARDTYGEAIYGCFLHNKQHKIPQQITLEQQFLKIDAQVVNGFNKQLGDLRMTLLFKGVHFNDIDLEKSFPELSDLH